MNDSWKTSGSGKSWSHMRYHTQRETNSKAHGESNWTLSYADMMTSMVVFLLLLLSLSHLDYSKMQSISQAAKQTSAKDKARPTPIESVEEEFKKMDYLDEGIEFKKEDFGASLSIKSSIIFNSGSATIQESSWKQTFVALSPLKNLPADYYFVVKGHTDDAPIHSGQFASNWELSSARALSVLYLMREIGIEEKRLSIQAFGEHQPLFPNRGENGAANVENQKKNRRAIIEIRQKKNQM